MQATTTLKRNAATASILLPDGRNMECFPIHDIVRLEACSNYTYIYFRNGRRLLTAKVMHLLETFLHPHGFIRTHRGHVINPQFVMEIDKSGNVLLHDNTRIPFSRRRKKEVLQFFNQVNAQLRAA